MLVHCCCFVVNLVRGYTAARLLDALHQLGQVTWSPGLENYSNKFYAFRSTYISASTEVSLCFCMFFLFFFFFFFFHKYVLTFLFKCINLSWWHTLARTDRLYYDGLARPSCYYEFFLIPVLKVDVDFVDCFSRVDTCCVGVT